MYRAKLKVDRTICWNGVSTGKCTLLTIDRKSNILAYHIAGEMYFSGIGCQSYAPAHIHVAKFNVLTENNDGSLDVEIGQYGDESLLTRETKRTKEIVLC